MRERAKWGAEGLPPHFTSGHGLAVPGRGQASFGQTARGPEGRRQRQRHPQRRPAWPPKEGRGEKTKGGCCPPPSAHDLAQPGRGLPGLAALARPGESPEAAPAALAGASLGVAASHPKTHIPSLSPLIFGMASGHP